MTRRVLAAGAGASSIIAAVVALSPLASAQSHPQLTERQLLRLGLSTAAQDGDSRPTLIQHAEGTRSKANQVASGGYFGGPAWSYLIAVRGHFVADHAIGAPGAPPPRGTVITLIVNAATGKVTDDGISYRYPPLAQLGAVTTDYRTYPSCPANGRRQFTSTAAGAADRLVPGGARQVLLCRYSGLNPKPSAAGRLLAHRFLTSSSTVTQLASEFDSLKPFPSGSYSCPADFGVKILAIFRYPHSAGSDDPVTVDPGGCTPVTNGHLSRTAAFAPGPKLIGQLARLTGTGVLDASAR